MPIHDFVGRETEINSLVESLNPTLDPLACLPDNLNELQTLYLSLFEGKRVLIIVDQVGNKNGINLLIPPPTCALLLTTRHQSKLPTTFSPSLDKLSPTDAEQLLLTICPRVGSNAPVLARLCRYTPLALRLSAALLTYDLYRYWAI